MMKKFVLCVEEDIRGEFIEAVQDLLRGENVTVNISGGRVEVTVRGSREDILEFWSDLRRLIRDLKYKREGRSKGGTVVSIPALYSSIGGTVPLEALLEAVRIIGGRIDVRGEYIHTNLSEAELVNLAINIREAFENVKYQVKGKALRNLVSILVSVTSMTPSQIVEFLEELEFVRLDEEGRAYLVKDWREVLRKVIREYFSGERKTIQEAGWEVGD